MSKTEFLEKNEQSDVSRISNDTGNNFSKSMQKMLKFERNYSLRVHLGYLLTENIIESQKRSIFYSIKSNIEEKENMKVRFNNKLSKIEQIFTYSLKKSLFSEIKTSYSKETKNDTPNYELVTFKHKNIAYRIMKSLLYQVRNITVSRFKENSRMFKGIEKLDKAINRKNKGNIINGLKEYSKVSIRKKSSISIMIGIISKKINNSRSNFVLKLNNHSNIDTNNSLENNISSLFTILEKYKNGLILISFLKIFKLSISKVSKNQNRVKFQTENSDFDINLPTNCSNEKLNFSSSTKNFSNSAKLLFDQYNENKNMQTKNLRTINLFKSLSKCFQKPLSEFIMRLKISNCTFNNEQKLYNANQKLKTLEISGISESSFERKQFDIQPRLTTDENNMTSNELRDFLQNNRFSCFESSSRSLYLQQNFQKIFSFWAKKSLIDDIKHIAIEASNYRSKTFIFSYLSETLAKIIARNLISNIKGKNSSRSSKNSEKIVCISTLKSQNMSPSFNKTEDSPKAESIPKFNIKTPDNHRRTVTCAESIFNRLKTEGDSPLFAKNFKSTRKNSMFRKSDVNFKYSKTRTLPEEEEEEYENLDFAINRPKKILKVLFTEN